MKSLATLIKLQKTLVDEQQQQLARLQDNLERIESEITQLEITKIREQAAAYDENTRATYGLFLKGVIARGRTLEEQRKTSEAAVKIAQDKLSELFEEQKRYETAEALRLEEQARAERRLERLMYDEIGGVMHERNKDSKSQSLDPRKRK